MTIMDKLEAAAKAGANVTVHWYYDEEDRQHDGNWVKSWARTWRQPRSIWKR